MRINGKELINNERLTFSQIEYLHKRYENLVNYLENKYPDWTFILDVSRQSEAGYLTLINDDKNIAETVSFRNHNNYADSNYDYVIWLSRFENWNKVKKHFLNEVLIKIINN